MRDDNLKQLLRIFPEITIDGFQYLVKPWGIGFTLSTTRLKIFNINSEFHCLDKCILEIQFYGQSGYLLKEEDLKFILVELNDYFNRPYKEKIIKTIIYESDSKN